MRRTRAKPETVEECLICVRVSRAQMLIPAFDLWEHDDAITIVDKAGEMIRDIYLSDPPFLCGKSPTGLIAGALYLASLLLGPPVTQRALAEEVGVSKATIRTRYLVFMEKLGLEHKDLPFLIPPHVRAHTQRGQCKNCQKLTFPDKWHSETHYGWPYVIFECPSSESENQIKHNSLGVWRKCGDYELARLDPLRERLLEEIKTWGESEIKRLRRPEFRIFSTIPED